MNELGSFPVITDGVIFHNTLASSDYGFLEHGSFTPRPNYFAVLLWNRLMGTKVYDCGGLQGKEQHIYCHSRRDGKAGVVYLILNNSPADTLTVEFPGSAERYTLSADSMRSTVMRLNGRILDLSDPAELPDLSPETEETGSVTLEPGTCSFLVCRR